MKVETEGHACIQVGCGKDSAIHDVWVDLPRSRVPLVLSSDGQVSMACTEHSRTFLAV